MLVYSECMRFDFFGGFFILRCDWVTARKLDLNFMLHCRCPSKLVVGKLDERLCCSSIYCFFFICLSENSGGRAKIACVYKVYRVVQV